MLFSPCHSFNLPDNFKVPSGMQRSVSVIGPGNWGSSTPLQEAAHAGASVASVHPVMSFPTRTPVTLEGAPFEPIARATLENFFLRGAGKSFSGPIARGDVQTIRLHLQALEPHPILAGLYGSLALDTLPAPGRKELRASLRPK
jgi:predicted short-subunit dehydrogenase-like oxidoreductase (DUF2520 family)